MTVATIGMHKGTAAHQAHNRRDPKVADKLEHIDRTKYNITRQDIDVKKAYDILFSDAVKEYNNRQKRADRKIDDYYEKVCKDKRLNPVYEYIVGVYPKEGSISEAENVEILEEFCDRFVDKYDRHGSLRVCGEYIHLDEASPHLHLDYIPVGSGYKKGMSLQVSQERALNEMGFHSEKYSETALVKWEADVNELMEEICKEHGIEVIHPDRGKGREHLETEAYKAKQDLEKAQKDLLYTQKDVEREKALNDRLKAASDTAQKRNMELREDNIRLTQKNKGLIRENNTLITVNKNIDAQNTIQTRTIGYHPPILKEKRDSVTISRDDYNTLCKKASDYIWADQTVNSFLSTDFSREYQSFLALKQQQEEDARQAKQKLENAKATEQKANEQKAFWTEQGISKYAAGLEQTVKKLNGEIKELKQDYNELADDYNRLYKQTRQRDYDDYEL